MSSPIWVIVFGGHLLTSLFYGISKPNKKRLASIMEANLKSREQSIIKTATFDFENLLILRPFALTHSQVLSECQRAQARSWQTS